MGATWRFRRWEPNLEIDFVIFLGGRIVGTCTLTIREDIIDLAEIPVIGQIKQQ
jgi:hypothetical protein